MSLSAWSSTFMRSRFMLQFSIATPSTLRPSLVGQIGERIESLLHKSTRNEGDRARLEEPSSISRLSQRRTGAWLKKLTSAANIKKYLEDEPTRRHSDWNPTGHRMANIYEMLWRTFASIISNNQNNIMKTLALVTITLVSGLNHDLLSLWDEQRIIKNPSRWRACTFPG